jgi:uroporphyrinogen-III decarboxylase
LPFDALAFEEDRKGYGIDLAKVRRIVGSDRVLFGNIDALFLETASDRELLLEVRRQIAVGGPADRFVVSTGSPLTPRTTRERLRFFVESTRSR